MKHVTKSVTGRHQNSDETRHAGGQGVTKTVTSLSTTYRAVRAGVYTPSGDHLSALVPMPPIGLGGVAVAGAVPFSLPKKSGECAS
jgi:hypothetical protein